MASPMEDVTSMEEVASMEEEVIIETLSILGLGLTSADVT